MCNAPRSPAWINSALPPMYDITVSARISHLSSLCWYKLSATISVLIIGITQVLFSSKGFYKWGKKFRSRSRSRSHSRSPQKPAWSLQPTAARYRVTIALIQYSIVQNQQFTNLSTMLWRVYWSASKSNTKLIQLLATKNDESLTPQWPSPNNRRSTPRPPIDGEQQRTCHLGTVTTWRVKMRSPGRHLCYCRSNSPRFAN